MDSKENPVDSNRTTIEQVRDLARILIDATLKDGPTIKLSVRAEDEALEIEEGQLELRREGQKFYLEIAAFQNNYPHGPDYVDMVSAGEYLDVMNAARAIVESLANMFMERKLGQLADDAMAEEMAKEECDTP